MIQTNAKYVLSSVGVLIGMIILVCISFGISYMQWYNYGATTEQSLQTQMDDNKNILSKTTLKVKEMAQVPGMYSKDLKNVIDANFQGRYGKDGSKAVFSFIKEHNISLDPKMYLNIQNTISAGRDEFAASQTNLLDMKRSYQTNLDSMWSGFILRSAGYPKINLNNIKIITSTEVDNKFVTGHDDVIKLK